MEIGDLHLFALLGEGLPDGQSFTFGCEPPCWATASCSRACVLRRMDSLKKLLSSKQSLTFELSAKII